MNLDAFLEWHLKITNGVLSRKKSMTDEVNNFIDHIETCIEAYCEVADDHSVKSRMWNAKAERLCKLRDQIKKLEITS